MSTPNEKTPDPKDGDKDKAPCKDGDKDKAPSQDAKGKESKDVGAVTSVKETSSTRNLKKIRDGFKIVNMEMTDSESGESLWQRSEWEDIFTKEIKIKLPTAVHKAKTVARTMKFSTVEAIENLRLMQRVLLHGQVIEVWNFKFGFSIPNSTNSWQCVIESAGDGNMIPVHILSGNVVIETQFFDAEKLIAKSSMRIIYED